MYEKSTKNKICSLLEKYPDKIIVLIYPFLTKFIKGTSSKDYVMVEFFPFDYYSDEYKIPDFIKFCRYIKNKVWFINNTKKEFEFIKEEREKNPYILNNGSNLFYSVNSIDAYSFNLPVFKTGWMKKENFFPLKEMDFEDTKFYAPQNHIQYLNDYFGANWTDIPDDISPVHAKYR
jgi:phosphorylcholine metabolism protein LicD